jgi:hypothetical protein
MPTPGYRLEQYTLKQPNEVLLVQITIAGEPDQLLIFKGFSSSLMRPTAADPDIPLIPGEAEIVAIDCLYAPYRPNAPRYIQQGLTWETMQSLLEQAGV